MSNDRTLAAKELRALMARARAWSRHTLNDSGVFFLDHGEVLLRALECETSLRASLAAAEAKLADAEKHADALYRSLVDLRLVCDMVERPAVEARISAIFAAHAARRKEESK